MTSGVHTNQTFSEVSLHGVLEVEDVGVLGDKIGGVAVRKSGGCGIVVDVTAETTRVVSKTVGLRVGWDITVDGRQGTEVDGPTLSAHDSETPAWNELTCSRTDQWSRSRFRFQEAGR